MGSDKKDPRLSRSRSSKNKSKKRKSKHGNEEHLNTVLPELGEKLQLMNNPTGGHSDRDKNRSSRRSSSKRKNDHRRSSSRDSEESDSAMDDDGNADCDNSNNRNNKHRTRSGRQSSSSSRRRNRRSSSRNSDENDCEQGADLVMDEVAEKIERMERTKNRKEESISQHGQSNSRRSSSSDGNRRRQSSSRSDADVRRHRGGGSSHRSSRSRSTSALGKSPRTSATSVLSDSDDDDFVPGAFRVSSIGEVSTTVSGDDISVDDMSSITQSVFTDASRSSSAGRSTAITRSLRSVSEASTMVEAVMAQDIAEELEEARAQGRREALDNITNRNSGIAVAVTADEDEASKDTDEQEDGNRKKKVRCYILLFFLFLVAAATTVTMLLLGRQDKETTQLVPSPDEEEESNAKVVIVYTPPTQEECEAIANGTILDDQLSLIQRSFDIQIDISLASEADFAPLFADILRYIQQKLVPLMAGCGEIDFFDTTIAIAEGLKNATNAIANGQAEEESEELCTDTNATSSSSGATDGVCRSYVLVLDLYLTEEKSSASLIQVIGNALNGDDIQTALGALYPVQTASVAWIVPSEENNTDADGTQSPSDSNNDYIETVVPITPVPNVPSLSDPPMTVPTLAPITQRPVSRDTLVPTTLVPNSVPTTLTNVPYPAPTPPPPPSITATTASPNNMEVPMPIPTVSPTKKQTAQPTRVETKAPTRSPTSLPATMEPNPLPTVVTSPPPTNSPTNAPITDAPSPSPSVSAVAATGSPTLAPVIVPSEAPSVTPSRTPTEAPVTPPSPVPSSAPTLAPTKAPSKAPSMAPVTPAPTVGEDPLATYCCSNDYKNCGNLDPACDADQFTCQVTCNAHWMVLNSCPGFAKFVECTNDQIGCCPPGVCTQLGPTYYQCQ